MAKIVVVEDDVLLSKMYVKLLTFENHEVVVASDGEQALPTIKKEKPDIILMDIMMPKMNGYQFWSSLRKETDIKETPLLVLTAKKQANDVFWRGKMAPEDYIIKTDHMQNLIDRIKSKLEEAKVKKEIDDKISAR